MSGLAWLCFIRRCRNSSRNAQSSTNTWYFFSVLQWASQKLASSLLQHILMLRSVTSSQEPFCRVYSSYKRYDILLCTVAIGVTTSEANTLKLLLQSNAGRFTIPLVIQNLGKVTRLDSPCKIHHKPLRTEPVCQQLWLVHRVELLS